MIFIESTLYDVFVYKAGAFTYKSRAASSVDSKAPYPYRSGPNTGSLAPGGGQREKKSGLVTQSIKSNIYFNVK